MKRILMGLGCSLVLSPGAFAQDGSPSARLGPPAAALGRPVTTVRAQAPDVTPAAAFDFPKVMPKGAVTETPAPGSAGSSSAAPGTLPMPGPALTIPPSGPVPSGPVIIDPPGTPIPGGTFGGGPFVAEPPIPGLMGASSDPSRWYVAAEALAMWVKSYSVPALVTSGPAFSGANLSVAGVTSLYGANSVDVNPRYGGKLTLGYWLSPCWAVELSGFYVRPTSHQFAIASGDVGGFDLARPFRSANTGLETSEIVGRPGIATGSVLVDEDSRFYGAELNARYKYWEGCNNRLHLIGGLRFLYLDEKLTINEQSTALAAAGPFAGISRAGTDSFHTKNRFYGAQFGAIFTHVEGPWTFELTGKIAAGVTRSIVDINGAVTPIAGGTPPGLPGNLLALNSNIGSQDHSRFSVVPEFGLNVGYDLTPHLRVYAGYSILYWTGVSRPGRQIDRVLDENRIPGFPGTLPAASTRPIPPGNTESLWAQGVSFGLLYRW